jgi:hypothetical protein
MRNLKGQLKIYSLYHCLLFQLYFLRYDAVTVYSFKSYVIDA